MEHAEDEIMDDLYDMEQFDSLSNMASMGQYNPFNSPYNNMGNGGMMNQQMMPNGALFNMQNGGYNIPFTPSTRYGMRGKKNRMSNFMRTGRQFMNDPRYQSLINQYQNMLAQQQQLSNNWVDADEPLDDLDEIDELNQDDIFNEIGDINDDDDNDIDDFDDDINREILFNEKVRQRMQQRQRKKKKRIDDDSEFRMYDNIKPKIPKHGKKKTSK